MNKFSKLKIGTPITGWGEFPYDNYVVIGIGFLWAVLEDAEGDAFSTILRPYDEYYIGYHEQKMVLVEES